MRKKLIGFDFDGVLIDSCQTMEKAWLKTCEFYNIKIPFSSYKLAIGKPFEVIITELGLSNLLPGIREKYFKFSESYDDLILQFSEAVNTLNLLNKSQFKTAIITSKPRHRTEFLLKRFKINSHLVLCPEDCPRGKPNPDPLFLAEEYFNLRSDQCIYIGDMDSDYLSAKRAGWGFIYAAWGYGNLNENINIVTCSTPAILYKYVKKNFCE
tara:strand:- start:325 stop:957 length:633 start_codon:yes stop_codon:yes gene_type:complete